MCHSRHRDVEVRLGGVGRLHDTSVIGHDACDELPHSCNTAPALALEPFSIPRLRRRGLIGLGYHYPTATPHIPPGPPAAASPLLYAVWLLLRAHVARGPLTRGIFELRA